MGSSYVNILFEFRIIDRVIRILGVSDCHHSVNNTTIDEDVTKLQVLDEYRLPHFEVLWGFRGEKHHRGRLILIFLNTFLIALPVFLADLPIAFPALLSPFPIFLPTFPTALNGFKPEMSAPKNAATLVQKKNAITAGLLTDDEQLDAILDIIMIGNMLAAMIS